MKQIIHTLFEQQALASPARIAIRHGGQTVSYGQLHQQVNAIAGACLQVAPTQRGVVLVLLPKQPAVVATLLGVFKAGKVYLPVSWQLGDNTWCKIWQDIKPQLIVTLATELPRLEALLHRLQAEAPAHLLALDAGGQLAYYTWRQGHYHRQELVLAQAPACEVAIAPDDTCYLFFSSGTTGTPKVIEGMQKSLSHFIHWITKEFGYTENFRIAQLAALTFDASLRDMLAPLITGGTLCIPPADSMSNIGGLLHWLREERITLLCTVPSVFRAMMQEIEEGGPETYALPSLRFCLLAGETLYNKDVYRWQKSIGTGTELVNLYGTTESTMLKSFHRIGHASGKMSGRVSVGKPISNTLILLLNGDGKLCAVGEEGDVYIKTPFLTKGYYNDPQATAKIYVPNPLTQKPTDLVYKTGDVATYLPDGTIALIGRKDGQIKLRGIRLDLAGVEAGMLQHKSVEQVKCRVLETAAGDQYLVGYYSAHAPLDEPALRTYCQERLNAYEVPDYLVYLERFPINGHGKVDLAALPNPLAAAGAGAAPVAETLTPTEQQLQRLWQQLLQVENVGATDNFFKIGGNSLKAIQLGASITRTMHLELGVDGIRQLFKAPTLSKFAAYLDELLARRPSLAPIRPAAPRPAYPLSFAQQQIWFGSQAQAGQSAYNMAQAYHLRGPLRPDLLAQALHAVVARHEALRTSFHAADGQLTQRVHAPADVPAAFRFADVSTAENPVQAAEALIAQLSDTAFELTQPALLQLLLLELGPQEYVLGFVMHHIVGDSWSGQILISELLDAYKHLQAGAAWAKAPLAIHYKDYAVDEQQRGQGERWQQLQAFWQGHLGRRLPVLALPTDWPRSEQQTTAGSRYEFELAPALLLTLKQVAAAHEISLFALLLSAYYLVLNRYSADEEIVVGVPVAVRNRSELVNQIGVYVNTLALKVRVDEAQPLKAFLAQVQQVLLEGYAHQEYPFQEVVRHYAPARDARHGPVFDVAINMLTSAQQAVTSSVDSLRIADWDQVHTQSKFDLTLYVYDDPAPGTRPFIEYKTSLFKPQYIERFAERLVGLLGRFAAHPEQPLSKLLAERVALPALKKPSLRPALAE
ncbi:condensation domain-containing protein [Hymenobacter cheonanensis]|uniref:condensation domain-containing protein n=1 Tax=Hymenobacter sp. CA2-7 TaxID=3063993 RepID=UPI002712F467|nr:condensation domain-containing protein [Hymenobacter sp. CA2-7]MDO7888070.1 condensation domain-containing protein [Hymenobacter sp. CA2-7]